MANDLKVGKMVSGRWGRMSGGLHVEILDLPAASVCGKAVIDLCRKADSLIDALNEITPDESRKVKDVVRHAAEVVLFG